MVTTDYPTYMDDGEALAVMGDALLKIGARYQQSYRLARAQALLPETGDLREAYRAIGAAAEECRTAALALQSAAHVHEIPEGA